MNINYRWILHTRLLLLNGFNLARLKSLTKFKYFMSFIDIDAANNFLHIWQILKSGKQGGCFFIRMSHPSAFDMLLISLSTRVVYVDLHYNKVEWRYACFLNWWDSEKSTELYRLIVDWQFINWRFVNSKRWWAGAEEWHKPSDKERAHFYYFGWVGNSHRSPSVFMLCFRDQLVQLQSFKCWSIEV